MGHPPEARCEMAPHALYLVVEELASRPDAEIIYSDEDRIDTKASAALPVSSQTGILTCCYPAIISVASLFTAPNGCDSRAGSAPKPGSNAMGSGLASVGWHPPGHIRHIPRVLCHRQEAPTKHFLHSDTEQHILEAHLHQKGIRATVTPATTVTGASATPCHTSPARLHHHPTRNGLEFLAQCIKSVLNKTAYVPFEIIVVDNQSDDDPTLEYLRQLEKDGSALVLSYDAPFNYSAINNFAVSHARGEFLCLLNNDIEVIHPDWLEELVGQAARPEAGAVGAMLYYPDGSIQHAGVLLKGKEVATHFFARMPAALLDTRPEHKWYRTCLQSQPHAW